MQVSLIVVGALNTDIVTAGLQRFPRPGELVCGKELFIGPGGKSRNIAAMAAQLMGKGKVAMISRTAQDKYGLWKVPFDALREAGVSTKYVAVDTSENLPGVAVIAVDEEGTNRIIALPGASRMLGKEDVDTADALFAQAAKDRGYMAITLECPFKTARHAIKKAQAAGLKVVLDPGGFEHGMELALLLNGLYLIKPNEHEAGMIAGVGVKDFDSARRAANKLIRMGVENVLITAGANGAYLFTPELQKHIPIPDVPGSGAKDETACGDQAMATLCAYLESGKSLATAAEVAVLAGTLQFGKRGVQPVMRAELKSLLA